MKLPGGFSILSTKPLYYIDDEGEIIELDHTYDDLNVVRVWDPGCERTNFHYTDYPIEEPITYIPKLGFILFSTTKTAKNYVNECTYSGGLVSIIENLFEQTRHSKYIVEIKKKNDIVIPDGLYSIPSFDDALINSSWLQEIRYLDENDDIKKIKPTDDNINEYIKQYLLGVDIETRHNFENERLIFEIFTENDIVYINHFFVNNSNEPQGCFYYTRIQNYPLFGSKHQALDYRRKIEIGLANITSAIQSNQYWINMRTLQQNDKNAKISSVKSLGKWIAQFAWDHLDSIIEYGKAFLKKKILSKGAVTAVVSLL
jgi:hypothetical protein